MQRPDRRVERVGDPLLDRRGRFAPGHRCRVRADHAVVLLQHLRAGDAELHAAQVGRRLHRTLAALAHRDHARVYDHIPQRLEALGLDQRMDLGPPGVGIDQVDEFLIGAAEVRQVDQVDHRRERREVGQRVLGRLNRAVLHLLGQRAAGAQLAARGQLDVDLAAGGVLDVLLEVQLHDRVAARGAEYVGGGRRHDMLGRALALLFLLGGLRGGLGADEGPARAGDDGCSEPELFRHFQEVAALGGLQLASRSSAFRDIRHLYLP